MPHAPLLKRAESVLQRELIRVASLPARRRRSFVDLRRPRRVLGHRNLGQRAVLPDDPQNALAVGFEERVEQWAGDVVATYEGVRHQRLQSDRPVARRGGLSVEGNPVLPHSHDDVSDVCYRDDAG